MFMKNILKGITCFLAAGLSLLAFGGCGGITSSKTISTETMVNTELNHVDDKPTVTAPYLEESTAQFSALKAYFPESENSVLEIINGNDDVKAITAKLYAYACYNENYVSQYVYFSDRSSSTTLDGYLCESSNQDYKAIIYKTDTQKGLKYHHTLKHVTKADASLPSMYKNLYEDAKLRFVDDTLLYRFASSGSTVYRTEKGRTDELTTTWDKKGTDWAKEDLSVVAQEKISADSISADIVDKSSTDENSMKGNINIFAENIIKDVRVQYYSNLGYYLFYMTIDSTVANSDSASLAMLRQSNSSNDCKWDKDVIITFVVWESGLLRSYHLEEQWTGSISKSVVSIAGSANSQVDVEYSYADEDLGYDNKMAWLAEAKESLK
jgi:hypothetical protein